MHGLLRIRSGRRTRFCIWIVGFGRRCVSAHGGQLRFGRVAKTNGSICTSSAFTAREAKQSRL